MGLAVWLLVTVCLLVTLILASVNTWSAEEAVEKAPAAAASERAAAASKEHQKKAAPTSGRAATASAIDQADAEVVEEIVVKGRQFRVRPNEDTMIRTRDAHARGSWFYRKRLFREAFPYLMTAAKRGFKISQARVGFIYQQGLGGVPVNGGAAIGWLGVAASGKTSPEIANYYKDMRAKVPDAKEAEIDRIVARYIAEYGSEATGIHCDNTRMAGSHISTLKCDHEDEYEGRDVLDRDAIFGITNGIPNPLQGGGGGSLSAPGGEASQ
jgi:hypothetical protein